MRRLPVLPIFNDPAASVDYLLTLAAQREIQALEFSKRGHPAAESVRLMAEDYATQALRIAEFYKL